MLDEGWQNFLSPSFNCLTCLYELMPITEVISEQVERCSLSLSLLIQNMMEMRHFHFHYWHKNVRPEDALVNLVKTVEIGDCGNCGDCGDCGDGGDCGDCGDWRDLKKYQLLTYLPSASKKEEDKKKEKEMNKEKEEEKVPWMKTLSALNWPWPGLSSPF